jgi:hypothetical protein
MTGQINRGSKMGEQIFELAKLEDVKIIFEVGTWNGLGSTKCIYDAIISTNKKNYVVFSLECNLTMHNEAKINLLPLHNFNLIYGTITTLEEIIPKMENDKEALSHAQWLYEEKIFLKNAPYVFDIVPEKIDLLILDGGEYSSSLEFDKLYKRSRFIVLDDTTPFIPDSHGHILKNSQVREFILANPDQFRIIEDDLKDRNGYLICEHLV